MIWDMVQLFEHIARQVVRERIAFRLCFSSWHYPNITIERGLELRLEEEEGHNRDIISYVESELKIGKSDVTHRIKTELQEKASGVFMCAVLIVRLLSKESARRNGRNLQRKL